ncbi:hypothetical protein [Herbaspirillum hiltneri]|uniref:hypothetical protein n=1 Tax=Herbaspirillum hiltneri TaxID=341045 RepID=UPI0011874208|nr:hypothetical protein [Herbaspirillum hiltneri]
MANIHLSILLPTLREAQSRADKFFAKILRITQIIDAKPMPASKNKSCFTALPDLLCRNRTTKGGNLHAGAGTNRFCRAAARL